MSEFEILLSERAIKKDLKKLSESAKNQIRQAVNLKLRNEPFKFGKPLSAGLHGQRSLRVGVYRVLYIVDNEKKIVQINAIGHRKAVYD